MLRVARMHDQNQGRAANAFDSDFSYVAAALQTLRFTRSPLKPPPDQIVRSCYFRGRAPLYRNQGLLLRVGAG